MSARMKPNVIREHVTFREVIEHKKDRHERGLSIHEKHFKTASFPAITITLQAGVGNDVKAFELFWENCILKLKMMSEVK